MIVNFFDPMFTEKILETGILEGIEAPECPAKLALLKAIKDFEIILTAYKDLDQFLAEAEDRLKPFEATAPGSVNDYLKIFLVCTQHTAEENKRLSLHGPNASTEFQGIAVLQPLALPVQKKLIDLFRKAILIAMTPAPVSIPLVAIQFKHYFSEKPKVTGSMPKPAQKRCLEPTLSGEEPALQAEQPKRRKERRQ